MIVDAEGNAVDEGIRIGTGMFVRTMSGTKYPFVILGDTNGDGKVGAADARLALRSAAKIEPLTGPYERAADMNGDGKVKAADARTILRIAAKLEVATLEMLNAGKAGA